MKILAVRGEGLASLAAPFEVDLEAPPLRDAGVFAIVGPTGAGKSTLLDAICLALFDRTPRLGGRGGKLDESDPDGIAARDPRQALRRGAAKGIAEVDFRGVDGVVYRARWEVRRARGRSDGRLKESAITLVDRASSRAIGDHRKGATLAAIEERLGLSFAQFSRATLLAQGEFAAFLEADDRERAELLERMTGTELYGQISIEVARRARDERGAYERLVERMSAIEVLDPAARIELEEALPRQRLDLARAIAHTRDLERDGRWWVDRALFIREEDDARRELAELDAQLDLVEPRRRELEDAARLESVRAELAALERAEKAREEVRAVERACADALARAGDALAGAAAEADAARRAREDAERELADRLEALARARELDRSIALARERVRGAERRAADAERENAVRAEELAAIGRERDAIEAQLDRARASRSALAAVDLGSDAPRWIERLARVRALRAQLAAAADAIASAGAALVQKQTEGAALHAERERWREALVAADRRVADRREVLGREPSIPALSEVGEALGAARAAIARALEHHARARRARARGIEHADHASSAEAARATALERHSEAKASIAIVRAALLEAERARDLAHAVLDLEARRAELRDGEPCPLCGAEDHPYARHAPKRLGDELDRRARELRDDLDRAQRAEARAEAEAQAAERERSSALLEAERAEAEARAEDVGASAALSEAASLETWWRMLDAPLRARLLGDEAVHPGGAASRAAGGWSAMIEQPGAADRALAETLERLEALRHRRAQLVAALEQATAEQDRARAAYEDAERAARRAESALEKERARSVAAEREQARIVDELRAYEPSVPAMRRAIGWAIGRAEGRLEDADELALARLATSIEEVEAARRAQAIAEAQRRAIEESSARAAAAHERAREVCAALIRDRELAVAELEGLRSQRAGIGIDDAEAEERARRAAIDRARELHAAAVSARAAAHEAHEAAQRARCAAIDRAGIAERELASADQGLERALESAGIDRALARRVLAIPAGEVAAFRRDLAALDARRARGRAVLEERRRRRERHEADGAPKVPATEIASELARARDQEEAARRLLAASEQWIARDDAMRASRDAIGAELDAQIARVRTWTQLESLIGSSDGKRFRVFAQGLTLDLLLDHANVHLERIARRYALRRAGGGELTIQVIDREMGDEIRGVHSLSGGETFLVSLALSLALASVTSRRIRVDSLFIDEGFGGLDADSLEIALAALDALQASGRQVGVISHVGAIAERFPARVEIVPVASAESVVRVIG